ncbi:hypothetical protein GPECTOR_12g348 [Gonium pectorale]|uniref:guanylate cyclase n=1 Tax=Gonium pectorale TaxID=33097 RepID=A0A150GNE9_GONPE|nr:hypothetical protein GPECTOR_12g348 [Gonium pectorale]|eukprot:KXZ51386.1 hypothetical protein GPECTOR_12g348 [Gonium pectorale]
MRSLGSNIAEFLANLNNLHLHLSMGFPSMVAPAFRVEQVTSSNLLLHYHSIRPALWPIVSGVLKGVSKVLFEHEVEIELVASREAGDSDHEVFRVSYPYQESLAHWHDHQAALASEYGMSQSFFYEMFPFHLLLDTDCCVLQAGSVMSRLFGETLTRGSPVGDTFKLRHPYIPLEYERMVVESDSLFLLKALLTGLEFKGQMVKTVMPDGRPALLFLGSPRVANLEEMSTHGLYLSDIPLHDMSRDFVLLAEQRQAEADLKERFEKMAVELRLANERLEQTTRWLDEERQRSDALLYRMLPADIAADLREGRKVEAINYPEVTILFSDMVGFTTTSARSTAEEVYNMLNEMYDKFDGLVDDFPDIYKLETIGDAYFLVCNLTTQCDNHVDVVIDFAIRMQAMARRVKNAQGEPVQIRIGIHTGPVVGGVLGAKTPRFSVYGDTVNVASRMESHGLPGKIHISGESYNRIVDKHKYAVRERGNIAVKGRGNMTTYLIGGTQDDWLLRHTSFDAQLDGVYREVAAGAASNPGRDGSFVITSSGRSVDNLSARSVQAMEAIKEGDEDRATRQQGSSGAGALLPSFSSSTGRPPAGPGVPRSGTATGTSGPLGGSGSYSPATSSPLVAVIASLPSEGTLANSAAAAEAAAAEAATAAAPGIGGAGGGCPYSGGAGAAGDPAPPPPGWRPTAAPNSLHRNSGSFREIPGIRESSFRDPPTVIQAPGLGRETSFRAVYARGGRAAGPNSPLHVAGSGGSRSGISGGGPSGLGNAAAGVAPVSGGGGSGGSGLAYGHGSSGALLNGGGTGESEQTASHSQGLAVALASTGGTAADASGHVYSRLVSTSHLGFASASPTAAAADSAAAALMRPEPSGGSGVGGLSGMAGVVMARSVTAKVSPLAQSSQQPPQPPQPAEPRLSAVGAPAPVGAAATAAGAAAAATTAQPAATPREGLQAELESFVSGGLRPPPLDAMQGHEPQAHHHPSHAPIYRPSSGSGTARADSSVGPQRSGDSMKRNGSDAGSTIGGESSGKGKGLASKLKNLFKK